MEALHHRIARNLDRVRERITRAAQRAGRSPDQIQLVAVTKYVDVPLVEALVEAGCRDLGENRPQELWRKAEALRALAVRWHLVGHLQRNKVRRTLQWAQWIHSADSHRLLQTLDRVATQRDLRPRVLLEVNISGEPQKHGFAPETLLEEADRLRQYGALELCGLMGMSAFQAPEDQIRRQFRLLAQLLEQLRRQGVAGPAFRELSMGMSHDLEIAVEEGATIVRVGTALWEGVLR